MNIGGVGFTWISCKNYYSKYWLTALLEKTYVDNIQGGGDVEEDAATFKEEASNIMSEGGFTLHKWHSNVERLNSVEKVTEGEETYAKSLVGNRET